jgi:exodeoxyribonuclease VII large subunit
VTCARSELTSRAGRLDALSPLAVLSRGYALARRIPDGAVLRDAEEARVGQDISVMLGRGSLVTKVESIEVENHGR